MTLKLGHRKGVDLPFGDDQLLAAGLPQPTTVETLGVSQGHEVLVLGPNLLADHLVGRGVPEGCHMDLLTRPEPVAVPPEPCGLWGQPTGRDPLVDLNVLNESCGCRRDFLGHSLGPTAALVGPAGETVGVPVGVLCQGIAGPTIGTSGVPKEGAVGILGIHGGVLGGCHTLNVTMSDIMPTYSKSSSSPSKPLPTTQWFPTAPHSPSDT